MGLRSRVRGLRSGRHHLAVDFIQDAGVGRESTINHQLLVHGLPPLSPHLVLGEHMPHLPMLDRFTHQ